MILFGERDFRGAVTPPYKGAPPLRVAHTPYRGGASTEDLVLFGTFLFTISTISSLPHLLIDPLLCFLGNSQGSIGWLTWTF